MKINMKEKYGFLITHSPLRSLRLCVKNYGVKKLDVTEFWEVLREIRF